MIITPSLDVLEETATVQLSITETLPTALFQYMQPQKFILSAMLDYTLLVSTRYHIFRLNNSIEGS